MLNIKNLVNSLFKKRLTSKKSNSDSCSKLYSKTISSVDNNAKNNELKTILKDNSNLSNIQKSSLANTLNNSTINKNNNVIQICSSKQTDNAKNIKSYPILIKDDSTGSTKIDIIVNTQQTNINKSIDLKNDVKKEPVLNDRIVYTHDTTSIHLQEDKNIDLPAQRFKSQNAKNSGKVNLLEEEYKKLKLDLSLLNQSTTNKYIPTSKEKINLFIRLLNFKWLFSLKILTAFIILLALAIVYVVKDLPNYNILEEYIPKTITRVYSNDGYILSELGLQNRSITNIENIPNMLKDAFISAEDKTFYSNFGFDLKGIARALINNSMRIVDKNRSLMGASTITQQVVKNILLNHDRTLIRKAKEAVLTVKLEFSLSKERILEIYLNEIYLGNGSYGVTTAALKYFNKPLNVLTLEEAAFLAILPRSPNGYNPKINYDGAKSRRDWVINRMLEDGKITQQEAKEAINKPIITTKRTDLAVNYSGYAAEEARKKIFSIIPSKVVYNEGLIVKTTINNDLQKFAYHSLRNGIENVDNLRGYRGALGNVLEDNIDQEELSKIDSTEEYAIFVNLLNKFINKNVTLPKYLDDWEIAVVSKIKKNKLVALLDNEEIIELDVKDNKWALPNKDVYKLNKPLSYLTNFNSILRRGDVIFVKKEKNKTEIIWKLKQIPKVNGAMVVINPSNGYILAMQGGFSFELSQFNRATQALRQPGSAFKTFVYLAALENGMTPSSLVLDAPYTISTKDKIWKPKNNTNRYAGYVTMRNALEVSRNLASIRIANFAGLDSISNVSKRLGIYSSNIDNFSEVIGSKETTLLKMVKAYSILVNGGKNVEPVLVNQIFNREGSLIFKNDNREFSGLNNIPWENQTVPSIPDIRETLIDERDSYLITNMLEGVVSRGIAGKAKVYGYNIGGKTGTTNDSKDLWFFGFTPQVVVGIYIGEDTPTNLEPAMASTMVVPIFKEFADQAFPLLFDRVPFKIPDGIELFWVDPKTGKPVSEDTPKKFLESFRSDNKPIYNNDSNSLVEEGDGNLYEGIY